MLFCLVQNHGRILISVEQKQSWFSIYPELCSSNMYILKQSCWPSIRVAKSWKISSKFWKLSRNFGNLPGILETFWDFWKFTGIFGNFLGFLEIYREFWKLSGIFGNLPGFLESFRKFSTPLQPYPQSINILKVLICKCINVYTFLCK